MIRHKRVPGLVREELHFPRLLTPIGWRSRRGRLLGTGKGNLHVKILLFAIWTSPILHLVSSYRCRIRICLGTAVIPRRNEKTKVVHFFFGGGGWGQTRCIMGDVQMANFNFIFNVEKRSKIKTSRRFMESLSRSLNSGTASRKASVSPIQRSHSKFRRQVLSSTSGPGCIKRP